MALIPVLASCHLPPLFPPLFFFCKFNKFQFQKPAIFFSPARESNSLVNVIKFSMSKHLKACARLTGCSIQLVSYIELPPPRPMKCSMPNLNCFLEFIKKTFLLETFHSQAKTCQCSGINTRMTSCFE